MAVCVPYERARALALSRLCVCICVWWSVPAVRCGAVGCVGAWNLVTCLRRVACSRASVLRWTSLRRSAICVRAHRLSFSLFASCVSLSVMNMIKTCSKKTI